MLVLEDLHWSDYSTLDLLALLARRQEPARLLLLGTYRPAEATLGSHPLHTVKQELQGHGLCAELPLTFLTETAVEAYLAARFPDTPLPPELSRFVHRRTDGNPLFMVNVVDDWLTRDWLVEANGRWTLQVGLNTLSAGVPENLRQLINQQVDRLSPQEQRLLEAGSVAGVEFSAAAVAAALEAEAPQVDEQCGTLVQRRQLLQERGEHVWPDGTVAGCYSFAHALYQEVVYNRLTAGQRVHLHRRIGERQEKGYGPQAGDIAAELAMHFERGRDYWRAIVYLQQAADNALQRYANAEGIAQLTTALQLLKTLPATSERHLPGSYGLEPVAPGLCGAGAAKGPCSPHPGAGAVASL
jgi:predicted ATPase